MAIVDIYSKRLKKANGDVPDVYQYDEIPRTLKNQIVQIFKDIFTENNDNHTQMESGLYWFCNKILCKEYGVFNLIEDECNKDPEHQIIAFFLNTTSVEESIDIIESFFKAITILNRRYPCLKPEAIEYAIFEINYRFEEHRVGYQFESGQVIRIDNEIIHNEATKPALVLLHDPLFKGANEEFLEAHEHYRQGKYKDCIANCCKALESTLKIICQINGWDIKPKDGASRLIDKCLKNGLLPPYLETQFTSLKSVLESGIPTIRNNTSGHGQGSETIKVPEYLAQYTLNLTASAIVFLVNAHKNYVPEKTPIL